MPAHTTSTGLGGTSGREGVSTATDEMGPGRERNAQTEAKMLTNRAHSCQINFPIVIVMY